LFVHPLGGDTNKSLTSSKPIVTWVTKGHLTLILSVSEEVKKSQSRRNEEELGWMLARKALGKEWETSYLAGDGI
jgi:hypothetical protein